MEFWEGAVLVVGGIWLVGRMSRRTVAVSAPSLLPGSNQVTLPNYTNTAGSDMNTLIAGEPLAGPTPSIPSVSVPMSSPVTMAPTRAPVFSNLQRAVVQRAGRPVAAGRSGASWGDIPL